MSFSLNKITLIGNLGQDVEVRVTSNNTEVASFSLATTNSYKGSDNNWVNDTTWHDIVLFNPSDFLKANLKKGKKFYVEGRLNKRNYENKEGNKVYVTEIIADKFNIIPLSDVDAVNGNDNGNSNSGPSDTQPVNEVSEIPNELLTDELV